VGAALATGMFATQKPHNKSARASARAGAAGEDDFMKVLETGKLSMNGQTQSVKHLGYRYQSKEK